jgi:hypothetical protein
MSEIRLVPMRVAGVYPDTGGLRLTAMPLTQREAWDRGITAEEAEQLAERAYSWDAHHPHGLDDSSGAVAKLRVPFKEES